MTDPKRFVSKEKDLWSASNVDEGLIVSRNEELGIHVIQRLKKRNEELSFHVIQISEKKFGLTSGDRSCLVGTQVKQAEEVDTSRTLVNQVHSRYGFNGWTSVKSSKENKYLKSSECARGLQFNDSGFTKLQGFLSLINL